MSSGDVRAVLFDLDGTIIDSSEGIQNAYSYAYTVVCGDACAHQVKMHVGPPVGEIFSLLSGENDPETVKRFVDAFKEKYDRDEYKTCTPYEGMTELLQELDSRKIACYIATNKRLVPTKLILDHLGLTSFFEKIYTPDCVVPSFGNKSEMVAAIVSDNQIDTGQAIFIGDTAHDKKAAEDNAITFIYANYGFGSLNGMKSVILRPLDILKYI